MPVCNVDLRPYVGQKFNSLEDAISFYEKYAREVCFDTRRLGNKSHGGEITWQYLVCNRQGANAPEEEALLNNQEGSSKKRKRGSKRCGCKAKIAFKFCSNGGLIHYVVHHFVEGHNHPMVEKEHKRFMKGNRKLTEVHHKFVEDCTKANIGPTSTFNLLKEFFGGYDSVGCTLNDVRNCSRDIKEKLKEVDVQMILNQMHEKKQICEGFFYKYQLASDGKLISLFWSDAESRRQYHMFGDVVAFDTTYSTNRYCMVFGPFTGKDNHGCPVAFAAGFVCNENCDAFSWLFTVFVECMGVAPRMIITDQDWGMKLAIEKVLVGTRHRWCMWHIMSKLFEKVPKSVIEKENFKRDFKACVWSDILEPNEFEELWVGIIQQYGLQDQTWFKNMFGNRHYWIPAYFRDIPMGSLMKTTSFSESENSFFKRYSKPYFNFADFTLQYNNALDAQRNQTERLDYYDSIISPILVTDLAFEKHVASLYTERMFRVVQEEISEADRSCRMIEMSTLVNMEIFKVSDVRHNTFIVRHEVGTDSYECECKLYGRRGILCCHIFFVFKNKDVKCIPEKYVGSRWLKKPLLKAVHGGTSNENASDQYSSNDDKKKKVNKCHGIYFRLLQHAERNLDDLSSLEDALEGLGEHLFGGVGTGLSSIDKNQRIENIYGAAPPEVIIAHPPDVVKTKGSGSSTGSRIESSKEKAIKAANKPLRRCGKCHEMVNHDSRNCSKVLEKLKRK